MSQISADSYTYNGGINDLSSVHSGNSYTGASDEFRYDATDMLYAWELSSRFSHHVHRGAKLEDLHLISAAPLTNSLGKGMPTSSASHPGDNYLLENPFDHSTIHFEDFPIKMNTIPSSSSYLTTSSSNNQHSKRKYSSESTITDELLEQFQKGIYLSSNDNNKPNDNEPTSNNNTGAASDDYHSQNQFYQFLSNYNQQDSNNKQRLDCPDRPFHLMKTHINLKLSLDDDITTTNKNQENEFSLCIQPVECIINMVTCYLNTYFDYDFSYFPKLYMWKGKFLQGSISCLINIHLYKEKYSNNLFIIEANRISGEAKPFHEFYKSFKQLLLSNLPNDNNNYNESSILSNNNNNLLQRSDSSSSSFDNYDDELSSPCFCTTSLTNTGGSGPNSPLKKINCGDFQKSIEPILNMSKCLFYEVKLEAAKMLCDISTCDDIYLRDNKCIDNIFKAIENLILYNDGFLSVKEQAIVAFGSFIEMNYQHIILNRMLKSNILHILLQLINNPINESLSYETAQMRRECARIISILSTYDSKGLLQSLELQQISIHALKRWFDNIDNLKDQRTRIYAIRIRDSLMNVIQGK